MPRGRAERGSRAGRDGSWASPRGNLYVSVLLRPPRGRRRPRAPARRGCGLRGPGLLRGGRRGSSGRTTCSWARGRSRGSSPRRRRARRPGPRARGASICGLGGARPGPNLDDEAGLPAGATSVRAETGRAVPLGVRPEPRSWCECASGIIARRGSTRRGRRRLARARSPLVGVSRRGERGRTAGPGRGQGHRRTTARSCWRRRAGRLERIVSGEVSRVRRS